MSCQIFSGYFVLLLFVFYDLYGFECSAQGELTSDNNDGNTFSRFFEAGGEKINIDYSSEGKGESDCKIAVKKIESVFLVATKNLIVAFADIKEEEKKIDILAKFVGTKNKDWNTKTLKESVGDWKTQVVRKNPEKEKDDPTVKSSAIVANGDKIYYFSVNNSKLGGDALEPDASEDWHITVVIGNVADQSGEKTITWDPLQLTKLPEAENLKTQLNLKPKKNFLTVGFGFVMRGKIVFAIQVEANDQSKNKYVTVFFQLDELKKELKLLRVEPTGNCHPFLFLWKEQIVLTQTVCAADSNQKISVFDYKNDQLTENNNPTTFLYEFLKDKKNFFTTEIVTTKSETTTEVLLFTQQIKETEKLKNPKEHGVYLWVTDGSRTAKVDTIITEDKDNIDLSMLHINKDLFVLYKQKAVSGDSEDKSTYNLKRLPDQMDKIKLILEAWKNTNNKTKELFEVTATTDTFFFTDNLVGFLSGGEEDNTAEWIDEYFYKNLTPINGIKVAKGFTFSKKNAGAQWTMGKQNEDQPYNFADPGFTLVATVKIEKDANEKDNSILGVVFEKSDSENSFGLWCNKEEWSVGDNKKPTTPLSAAGKCEKGETYYVALTLKSKTLSVYIDWKKVGDSSEGIFDLQQGEIIKHFYFGVDTDRPDSQLATESHVTVTNVLLYNQPFEGQEIEKFKKYMKPITKIKKLQKNNEDIKTPKEEVPSTSAPQTSNEEKEEKITEGSSPSRTEDGGVGGGVRVFSLLLAALCVSAPLLHL